MGESEYLQSGDALHVQTIHTSSTSRRLADDNIEIKHNCHFWNFQPNHFLAEYIHEIVSRRDAVFIAVEKVKGEKEDKGRVINRRDYERLIPENFELFELGPNECVVGV